MERRLATISGADEERNGNLKSSEAGAAGAAASGAGVGELSFDVVADSIDQMIWSTRPDGHHDYFNRRWYEFTGMPERSTDGEEWNGMFHPEDQERAWSVWRHSLATGEPYEIEYRLRHRSGEYRWVLGRARPVRDGGGTILRWYGTCTDIHDLKLAEEKRRESEARLQRALEAGRIGDYEWDLRTGEIRWSDNLMRIVGLPLDTHVTGQTVFELIHPDDRPKTEAAVRQAIESDGLLETDYRILGSDGAVRWIASRGRVERDGSGNPVRLAGVNYDITPTRQTEERLRESQARLQTLAENLPNVMVYQVITSPDMAQRDYVYVSGSVARLLGVTPEQATSDPSILMGRIEPAELEEVLAEEQRAASELRTLDVEITGVRPDGSRIRSRVISKPRELPDGKLIWDGILIDITERKRAQEQAEETASLLRAIGDATPDLIFAKGLDLRLLYANAATCRTIGIPPERVVGASNSDLASDPGEAAELDANDQAVIDAGDTQVVEEVFTSPDGTRRVFRSAKTPMRDASGAVIGLVGVASDITDRVEAEELVKQSEERLRELADNIDQFAWTADKTGWINWYNRRWYDYTGTTLDEMQGWGWTAVHHPDHADRVVRSFSQAVASGTTWEETFPLKGRDGQFRWFLSRAKPIRNEAGEVVRWFGTNTDVEELRGAEERLREESRTLETLNRTGAALAAELDLGKIVQMVTDAGVELTGAEFGAFFHNVINEAGESYMLYTLSGARPDQFDFGMPRATAVFHPTFAGEGVIRSDDITADPRYGKSEPHYGMPTGHLPVRSYLAVPVISRSGEVIGGLFFGHSGHGCFTERHERLTVGIAAQAAVAIDNGRLFQAAQRELKNRERAEQELRRLNETLEQLVAEEVERRSQAEEALRQAQKMETLGQLTGGVAHDFNNLLQIVTGNIDLIQRNLPEGSARLRRAADNAARGAERAAVLTQRLLAFSRRQPLAPKAIDANRLVSGMSELLHRTLGETIEVETVLASGLWPVEADPNQLENAILNLAVNARDAMPQGGKLTIETANSHLDRGYAAQNAEVLPGHYVAICVSDTGSGMDAETVARAFEPFFTTKEVGKGTGLGLSMVYGFVKQSGGHLKIYSEPGEGTTVRIYLPRMQGEAAVQEAEVEELAPEGAQNETVLVCEDDDDVRAYTVEVLRELGYRVLEAHDGPSALRLLERQEAPVDLLFTDVVLPSGMTGAVLAEQARAMRPGLKVLFTTGYARDAIIHHGRLDRGVELITKPFSYSDLAARVRDMLDGANR